MAMACVFDIWTDTVSHTYIGNTASYHSINTLLLPLVFFSLISTKLRPSSPIISCVNSLEFLSSDLLELPFGISTSTLCLCFEIGHLDKGRCNFLKVEAKSYPLGVRISASDFLVSISYLSVMHLTEIIRVVDYLLYSCDMRTLKILLMWWLTTATMKVVAQLWTWLLQCWDAAAAVAVVSTHDL